MTFTITELNVVRWGEARGIVQNSTGRAQAKKTLEECGELIDALGALELACMIDDDDGRRNDVVYARLTKRKEVIDAIGDIMVTLTMVCACEDIDLNQCYSAAFEEIKNRKGYLRPDGIFVKEAA